MSLVIDADSEYLTSGAFDPGLTTAFAVGCWVKMGNQSAGWKPIANMYLNGEPTITHILLSVNGDHYDSWHYPQSGSERLDAGGTTSTSAWQWVVMEYDQATPKSAMRLNGTETQTASTDRGSYRDLIDRIRVGMTDTSMLSAGTVYGRMKLAHLTVWNRTLTGGEHTSAASGVNPQDIGSSDIVFYAEFDEDATVTIGSTSFTATGSPTYDTGDNPTVDAPGGGGGSAAGAAAHYYRQLQG